MAMCIHDHLGTLFHVSYEMGDDGVPDIMSVQATDAAYRPVGPDLQQALEHTFVVVAPGVLECFLSLVTESIHASRTSPQSRN
ncbi:MAG: hypothetical protein E6R03_07475 [Hyphomicrobiaceae bacterium]|nr:MAG: hypothetical protein E6R03_07475 [Hyphomicrobiaceae bacterium]